MNELFYSNRLDNEERHRENVVKWMQGIQIGLPLFLFLFLFYFILLLSYSVRHMLIKKYFEEITHSIGLNINQAKTKAKIK